VEEEAEEWARVPEAPGERLEVPEGELVGEEEDVEQRKDQHQIRMRWTKNWIHLCKKDKFSMREDC